MFGVEDQKCITQNFWKEMKNNFIEIGKKVKKLNEVWINGYER